MPSHSIRVGTAERMIPSRKRARASIKIIHAEWAMHSVQYFRDSTTSSTLRRGVQVQGVDIARSGAARRKKVGAVKQRIADSYQRFGLGAETAVMSSTSSARLRPYSTQIRNERDPSMGLHVTCGAAVYRVVIVALGI